jgi:hypothetical protein
LFTAASRVEPSKRKVEEALTEWLARIKHSIKLSMWQHWLAHRREPGPRRGFAGLLLGSVSANAAEHASCLVLIIHSDTPPPPLP